MFHCSITSLGLSQHIITSSLSPLPPLLSHQPCLHCLCAFCFYPAVTWFPSARCWSTSPVVVVANLHQSIDDPHTCLALNALAARPIHLHLARARGVSFKHGCTPVRVWLEQRAADESLGSKFLILKAFIHVYLLINPNTNRSEPHCALLHASVAAELRIIAFI